MKLSKLKAPQMVSVAVKDGHDSFFKKTFVISLSQKKKRSTIFHISCMYLKDRLLFVVLGRGAPWGGGLPGKGGLGGFCLRHDKIHLIPSHWQLISSQFFVVSHLLYFDDEYCPAVPPENHVIRPQNPLPLALGYKL